MIQIRQSVFETNSSSIHSLCISKGVPKIPKKIIFRAGDYGWGPEQANPASYLYSYCLGDSDKLRSLRDAVEALGVECKFVRPGTVRSYIDPDKFGDEDEYWGLINQPGDLHSFFYDLIADPYLLTHFLFSPASIVYVGSDAMDDDDICYIAEEDHPLHDDENFIYYIKTN